MLCSSKPETDISGVCTIDQSLCSVQVRLDNALVLLDLPFSVEFIGDGCIKVSTVNIVNINVKQSEKCYGS